MCILLHSLSFLKQCRLDVRGIKRHVYDIVGTNMLRRTNSESIVKMSVILHNLLRIREGLYCELGETFAASHSACLSLSEVDDGRQRVLRTQQ